MKITFETAQPRKAEAYVIFATAEGKLNAAARALDKKAKGVVTRAVKASNFKGQAGRSLNIIAPAGLSASHIVVMGLGKDDQNDAYSSEKIGSALTQALNSCRAESAVVLTDPSAKDESAVVSLALGAMLNSYRFDKYLTRLPKDKKPTLKSLSFVTPHATAARKSFAVERKIAQSVFLTRDLVSEVPNVLYPESFAAIIDKELSAVGIDVKILNEKDLAKLGANALLAVGQGSSRPPRLVTMTYNGGDKKQKPIAFVGKGVTFDTGGISIKPSANMDQMKWDMAGAGAVVGLMHLLASRKAAVNAVGIVALAENMPSGNATRPGDIVKTLSGQTVEILNTDAEGRLILCDALWYAQETFKPDTVIDMATLTGAVIVALGHEYAAVFSNDESLPNDLQKASKRTGENVWHMPLCDAWDKDIDCQAADMRNIGSGTAGSAIGAHFLKRFIKKGTTWAHLDIAGTAWTNKDRPCVPKGATAFGVRLLDTYVRNRYETQE